MYLSRKTFAFDCDAPGAYITEKRKVFEMALCTEHATFQNLDSCEISLTDVSHYIDSDPTNLVQNLKEDGKKRNPYIVYINIQYNHNSCSGINCCSDSTIFSLVLIVLQTRKDPPITLTLYYRYWNISFMWVHLLRQWSVVNETGKYSVPMSWWHKKHLLRQLDLKQEWSCWTHQSGIKGCFLVVMRVFEINKRLTNIVGWSATLGQVHNWE